MPFNLAEAAKAIIPDDLIDKASLHLEESKSGITRAFDAILPAIISGIADKAEVADGADKVIQIAAEQHQAGILDEPANFSNSSLLNKGAGLVNTIFDDKVSSLTGLVSNFASIKSISASTLLSITAPLIFAFLGKHASTNNLDANGLATMLSKQKNNTISAIPAGFNIADVLGNITTAATKIISPDLIADAHHEEFTAENAGNGLKFLLPLLLLVLLAAAAWYFMGSHADNLVKANK